MSFSKLDRTEHVTMNQSRSIFVQFCCFSFSNKIQRYLTSVVVFNTITIPILVLLGIRTVEWNPGLS